MGAYEHLWRQHGSFIKLSKFIESALNGLDGASTLSDLVDEEEAVASAKSVLSRIKQLELDFGGVCTHSDPRFPKCLKEVAHPAHCLYYQGYWNYTDAPSVAVVGSREPSGDGRKRARRLVKKLVKKGYAIVSGLAEGIDTEAHTTALAVGGDTIAVLGTPITQQYPSSNQALRNTIAERNLVISQYPVCSTVKRYFFPERNKTMAALADATVVVEAGETSGTQVQATTALQQGRKVFIPSSCFGRSDITWPEKLEEQGAIRVDDPEEVLEHLEDLSLSRSLPDTVRVESPPPLPH